VAVRSYVDSADRHMQAVYLTAGIIAELVLAVNGDWGAQLLMLLIIGAMAAYTMPFAEKMKKLLQCFFGAAFILCNMSLLFGYVDWFQVDGITYSLESSVVGELLLCAFALYVLREWEKIPADAEIAKVRLCKLQRGIRRLLLLTVVVVCAAGLLGMDMGIGSGARMVVLDANGAETQAGIFTNTAISFVKQSYGAFASAFSQNMIGIFTQYLGFGGACVALILLALMIWLAYRGWQVRFEGNEMFAEIAVWELVILVAVPTAWEMLPLYAVFIYGALREYMPELRCKYSFKKFAKRN